MNQFITLLAGLALTFNAVAADAKKTTQKGAKTPTSMTFKLDPAASKATWIGKKVAGSHTGTVDFKEGKFVATPDGSMTGEVSIDLNTIKNDDVKDAEYNKKLVNHLKSEDFFDVGKYPLATFKIKSFSELKNITPGQPNAYVKGDLTLRGVTKPFETNLFYTPNEHGFEAKGKLIVDRTQYGLKYNSKKFFDMKSLGDKMIEDNFEVDFVLVAKK